MPSLQAANLGDRSEPDRLPPIGDRRERQRPATRVPLMSVEPGFLGCVPERDRSAAALAPMVTRHELPIGSFRPSELSLSSAAPFGLLVITGAICRETTLADHASAHLFGPGTIVQLNADTTDASLSWTTRWSCVIDSTVVALDDDFPQYLIRWPALGAIVRQQLASQVEAALRQCALTGLSRVDDRILALFWHLADGWGTVRHDGIAIRLPLTHRLIGRLVAAERATISLGTSRLAERGLLGRTGTRTWLLNPDSRVLLAGSAGAA
jgi:CRP/FNR family transcriptional regulator, cyclic AMP receptor protein